MTRDFQERMRAVCFDANPAVGEDERRLLLYRRLVRHNLVDVAKNLLSRTREAVEIAKPGAFDALFADYLEQAGPRSHHLREIPSEFVTWAAPRMQSEWGGEFASLARLEMAEFEVGAAEEAPARDLTEEVTADHVLVFSNAKRLLSLSHSVHEAETTERQTRLLIYRDDEHCVRRLELSPVFFVLFERLFTGEALGASFKHACAATNTPLDERAFAAASALLSALGDAGCLLGAKTA